MSVRFILNLEGETAQSYDECLTALQAAMGILRDRGFTFEVRNLNIGTDLCSSTNGSGIHQASGWTPERQAAANAALRAFMPRFSQRKTAGALHVSISTIKRLNIGTRLGSKSIEELIEGLRKLEASPELIEKFSCMLGGDDDEG